MTVLKLEEATNLYNKIKEIDDFLEADGILTVHKANAPSVSVRYAVGVAYKGPGNGIMSLIRQERAVLVKKLEAL